MATVFGVSPSPFVRKVRVVLADLEMRGLSAARIDLTGEEVVAVRPVPTAALSADSLATRPRDTRRG